MLQHFKKIWYILGETRRQIPLLLIIFLISSLLEVFGIGLLSPFLSIISDPDLIQEISFLRNISTFLNISSSKTFIAVFCGFIILVFVIKSIVYFFSKLFILKFSHSHRAKMINTLNRAYLNSEYNFFIRKNSSTLIKNILVETQDFCFKVLLKSLYGMSNLFILVCLISLMAFTDFLLLVATLTSLLPVFFLIYCLKDRLIDWGKSISEATQNMVKTLNHGLGGFKETRIIGSAPYFEAEMEIYSEQYSNAASLFASFEMLPRILIEASLVIFIVLFAGISQFLPSRNTDIFISSMGVFAVASIRLLPAASQFMSAIGSIQSARYLTDVLYLDLKEAQSQIIEASDPDKGVKRYLESRFFNLSSFSQIDVSQISYRYSKNLSLAINEISLTINKGESVAFIGKSGAGKTTLVDIILGLLVPQSGDIAVDGVSIYDGNIKDWQSIVGYIPQSIFLLDDTVQRNIAFGIPDDLIDHQRVESAIAAAQLEELIYQLPDGIQTRVGERGVMLSGGQRQRIGIARALYHEREILVLDEATSALDDETEKQVSEAIQKLAGEKTLIIIAHRLSTIEHCDRVYMMEKGRIIKSGNFKEIVKTAYSGS